MNSLKSAVVLDYWVWFGLLRKDGAAMYAAAVAGGFAF
jgi:hypothetical protein